MFQYCCSFISTCWDAILYDKVQGSKTGKDHSHLAAYDSHVWAVCIPGGQLTQGTKRPKVHLFARLSQLWLAASLIGQKTVIYWVLQKAMVVHMALVCLFLSQSSAQIDILSDKLELRTSKVLGAHLMRWCCDLTRTRVLQGQIPWGERFQGLLICTY